MMTANAAAGRRRGIICHGQQIDDRDPCRIIKAVGVFPARNRHLIDIGRDLDARLLMHLHQLIHAAQRLPLYVTEAQLQRIRRTGCF